MKRNTGIMVLLLSIVVTSIGSVFKVMDQVAISEVLLWVGMISFVVGIGMILYGLFSRKTA